MACKAPFLGLARLVEEPVLRGVLETIIGIAGLLVGLGLGVWLTTAARRRLQQEAAGLRARLDEQQAQLQRLDAELQTARADLASRAEALSAAQISAARSESALAEQRRRGEEQQQALAVAEQRLQEQQQTVSHQRVSLAQLEEQLSQQRERQAQQLAQLREAEETYANRFKVLAGEALQRNDQSFSKRQDELLKPFAERIQRFESQIKEAYEQQGKERISLLAEIKRLGAQGERLSQEADSLAKALKGSAKTRGDWGEVMLERLLEHAGLRRGQEFELQNSFRSETGSRLQPDAIVHLPDRQCLIIDSKLSLHAWLEIQEAADELGSQAACRRLRDAVRQHLKGLSGKRYENLPELSTVDFVLMFIPIEAAFATVLDNDPELYACALEQNVVIVSPTTLLATLRTIALTWRYDRQEKNALKIAGEAGKMYDQLVAYTDSLGEVGQRLEQAQRAWEQARKRLGEGRGNLIKRAENVRRLGATAAKRLGLSWREVAENDPAAAEDPLEETCDDLEPEPPESN